MPDSMEISKDKQQNISFNSTFSPTKRRATFDSINRDVSEPRDRPKSAMSNDGTPISPGQNKTEYLLYMINRGVHLPEVANSANYTVI